MFFLIIFNFKYYFKKEEFTNKSILIHYHLNDTQSDHFIVLICLIKLF
jgi:hypothetical protein